MASTTSRLSPSRRNSVGKLNCPSPDPALPIFCTMLPCMIEHPDLLAQRVGDVNPLRRGINGDSRGPLEDILHP